VPQLFLQQSSAQRSGRLVLYLLLGRLCANTKTKNHL